MMCVIIVIGYIITIPILKEQGYTTGELWLRSLDLITIAIPPALPAVLSSCIAFSLRSLAFKDIFCIQPHRISTCGRIQTVVFDKTGTLTEENLKAKLHLTSSSGKNEQGMIECMALCHSIAQLSNGKMVGDPLDIEMYNHAQKLDA
jgi:cation-transporting ATPase 13A2